MVRSIFRLVFVLLAVLLLCGAIVFGLLQTSVGASLVEQRLRAWVHPALQLNGPVRVSVLPRLGLDLQAVTIASDDAAQPLLSAQHLQWQMSWAALANREIDVPMLYVRGLRLYRSSPEWGELGQQFDRWRVTGGQASGQTPATIMAASPSWTVRIKQALFEDMAVLQTQDGHSPQPLVVADQAEFRFDGAWPKIVPGELYLGARQLFVSDVHELGQAHALMEQLGMVNGDSWDVIAMDSSWQLGDGVARVLSGQISGSWGSLASDAGTIDLETGALAVDMVAQLTNAPRMRARGVEIQVRRSELRFTLTGSLRDPGVTWLNDHAR